MAGTGHGLKVELTGSVDKLSMVIRSRGVKSNCKGLGAHQTREAGSRVG